MDNIYQVGKDLEKFNELIEKLRYDANSANLNALIVKANSADIAISANERFLIKMELRQLAKPCTRLLDFRDLFKNSCQEFNHNGQRHFIDAASKALLLKETERYGNVYTMGAYYYICGVAKETSRKKVAVTQPKKSLKTQILSLTSFPKRKESRAYYASKINVFKTSPEQQTAQERKKHSIEAITTDLSQGGVCIKIKKGALSVDDNTVFVWFRGLEEEYVFNHDLIMQFIVVSGEDKGDFTYFSLKLHASQDQQTQNEYSNILNQLIRANQRRNKVPLEHVMTSIVSKGHEQYAISRMNNLPVALGSIDDRWYPLCLFQNDAAMPLYRYFSNQAEGDAIADVFASNYVQTLLTSNKTFSSHFYFIRLVTKSKKIHFALIPALLLKTDESARQMVAFAAANDQLKLFRLDGVTIDPVTDSYVPSSLPDSAGEVFENMNRQVSENALKVLSPAQRLCFITDVSDCLSSFAITEQWKTSANFSRKDFTLATAYKKHQLPAAPKAPRNMALTRAENNDFRAEDRFDYKMKLSLYPKGESQKSVDGTTLNISTKGLRISLNNPIALKLGTVLMVDFVSLNTGTELKLVRQPYKVVGKNDDQDLRLVIFGTPADHLARQTLRKMIYRNISRLKVSGLGLEIYGLSRAMRNIVASNHVTSPVFLSRIDKQIVASAIAFNDKAELPPLVKEDKTFCSETFSTILEQNFFKQRASQGIQNSNSEHPFDVWYLIAVQRKGEGENKCAWLLRDAAILKEKAQLSQYLNQVKHLGEVLIYRVETTKKGRVFNKYMRDEIQYLTQFGVGQSKEVLGQINNVVGLCYMTNETALILPLLDLL